MTQSVNIDLNDFFVVDEEGEYTVLHFKKPVNKMMIYDPGLYHTAICKSALCKIDKRDGKLYYRGIAAEELITQDFIDVAYFIIFGENKSQLASFKAAICKHFRFLIEQKNLIDAIAEATHPMDALEMAIINLSGLEHKYLEEPSDLVEKAGFLIAQVAIGVAYRCVRLKKGHWIDPIQELSHAEKILFQMHGGKNPDRLKKLGKILNTILILHAEHGQNCSAATLRSVASAKSNLYVAVASGMAAFNGAIHGGASQFVSAMYEEIIASSLDINTYVDNKIASKSLLMGFGQRTYNRIPNCWDPRVEKMYEILKNDLSDFPEIQPYRNVAMQLIERVSNDSFFQKKNLTPNPDLFNCIFYKLFGVPSDMNTSMLALGRISGWIANYIEHTVDGYHLTRPCDMTKALQHI